MGKPVLGENCRLEVIIEESYDFKVTFLGLPFPEAGPELCWVWQGVGAEALERKSMQISKLGPPKGSPVVSRASFSTVERP